MTVSHLTRTRDRLWSDLLVALGGSEAFLTRSLSERKILLEILETYGSSVSLLTIDDVDALLAAVVDAAGGTASHLRQSKHEMLAALVTALGGTSPSASSSSIGELLAACVNAADAGGGGGDPEWLPDGAISYLGFAGEHYYAGGQERVAADIFADPGTHSPYLAAALPSVTANGWEVDGDGGTLPPGTQVVQFSGALQSDFITEVGRSIIFDLTFVETINSLTWTVFSGNRIDVTIANNDTGIFDANGPGSIDGAGLGVGQHKVGFTVAPGTYSMWVDGVLIGTEILGDPMSLSDGEHAMQISGQGMFVASITNYAPLTGPEMVTLTTL